MTAPKRPALAPGDVLAGRYRLEEQVSTGSTTTLWRAADEVLARRVGIRLLPADGARAGDADRFLDAAADAGAVDLPVFARVYDAALEERPADTGGALDVAYVIREWVRGQPLDEALRADGPLEPEAARALVLEVARGLSTARSHGLAHGRLHPGNVVQTPDGRLKVLDLGIAAALPGAAAGSAAQDTRDLAALLYALLTARWPSGATEQPAGALATAPLRDGKPQRPGQARRGVPRALDELVAGILGGSGPSTPADLARALEQAAPAERVVRRRRSTRGRVPALVAAALLVIGAASYTAGRQIGAVEAEEGPLETLAEPSAPAPDDAAVSGAPLDLLGTAQVSDFDPPPGDGRESPGAVPNAYDGDPTTAWETERYSSGRLGGLKPGVGLLVDLGAPTALAQVELGLRAGTSVELRASDELGASLDSFPLVSAGGGEEVVRLEAGQTARYWLVALTELPPDEGEGFRGGIAEMVFLRG